MTETRGDHFKIALVCLVFGMFAIGSGALIVWAALDLQEPLSFDTWLAMRRPVAAGVTELLPKTGQQILGAGVGVVFMLFGILSLLGTANEFWMALFPGRRNPVPSPAARAATAAARRARRPRRRKSSATDIEAPPSGSDG